jgi:hypothetical protein
MSGVARRLQYRFRPVHRLVPDPLRALPSSVISTLRKPSGKRHGDARDLARFLSNSGKLFFTLARYFRLCSDFRHIAGDAFLPHRNIYLCEVRY